MRALLFDKRAEIIQEVIVDPKTVSTMQKYIKSDYIDMRPNKIGHFQYVIAVGDLNTGSRNDETEERTSAMASFGVPLFYGNLLFFKQNGGEAEDITDEEINNIASHMTRIPQMGLVVII